MFDLLCEQARASGPGGNGIVCLPYLAGERAPIWDPHAKGVFFGISLASRKRDFIRAILESGGYGMRWNISVIEEILGMKLSEIVCAGGQAASSFLVQLKADITGKTYYVSSQYREAATLGAAVLAGRGLGLNCKVNASEHRREFNPDKRNSKTYQTHYGLYKRLYFDLRKEFSHAR